MTYVYDVFISYKNQAGLVDWVADHFCPLLQKRLSLELHYEPSIFRDKVSIAAGDEWDPAIKKALATSRLIVAILTPQYFTSKWCVAEWLSMEKREKLSLQTANKLLIPVKFSNGDNFPTLASKRQFVPSTDFLGVNHTVVPSKSDREVALESKVKELAELVAQRLPIAPPFRKFATVDPATVKLPASPQRKRPTP